MLFRQKITLSEAINKVWEIPVHFTSMKEIKEIEQKINLTSNGLPDTLFITQIYSISFLGIFLYFKKFAGSDWQKKSEKIMDSITNMASDSIIKNNIYKDRDVFKDNFYKSTEYFSNCITMLNGFRVSPEDLSKSVGEGLQFGIPNGVNFPEIKDFGSVVFGGSLATTRRISSDFKII